MMEAVPTLAKWAAEHPDWRITRFHCAWVDRSEEKT
jgi:hypothetical protein